MESESVESESEHGTNGNLFNNLSSFFYSILSYNNEGNKK